MKRRTKHGIISALVLILLFSPSGCSSRKLEYHGNLGYDLSNIDYEEVVFNIYHSNTEQHTWEKLTEGALCRYPVGGQRKQDHRNCRR